MKKVKLGRVWIHDRQVEEHTDALPRYIICFPTKHHWRDKSTLSSIEDGLEDMMTKVRETGIMSVALPPVGCGLGGLDYKDVLPLMIDIIMQFTIGMTPPPTIHFTGEY